MEPCQHDEGGIGACALNGGPGNDMLDSGIGNDSMTGDKGNNTVDIASDRVMKLTDSLGRINTVQSGVISVNLANVERARLTGAATPDLTGLAIANLLTGNDGADRLTSFGGSDTLAGGQGNDTLQGGTGKDVRRGGLGLMCSFLPLRKWRALGKRATVSPTLRLALTSPTFKA